MHSPYTVGSLFFEYKGDKVKGARPNFEKIKHLVVRKIFFLINIWAVLLIKKYPCFKVGRGNSDNKIIRLYTSQVYTLNYKIMLKIVLF